ncbi:hypothetical protein [Aquisphaera insulae]|uniref:hypothetical protein n=1 Tax=Aquisphaera insulae TaxID=2712864 RepID=UPI0013ED11CD|nr:hypothetical protein [Aquisphaera insulae]
MNPNTLSDPSVFAQAVRDVARDAYRLRNSPATASVRVISRRIEALAEALGDRREGPLGIWLKNLGREVRKIPIPDRPPTRSGCRPEAMHPGVAHPVLVACVSC